jgi:hypothetical protein
MIMDVGRSCFRQALRFVRNDLGEQVYGTWFRAAPSAKQFPVPHRFGSPVWDLSRGEFSDLGFNAETPAAWVNGARLNSSDGTKWAGPLEYFVEGCPAPAQLPRGSNGTPVECLKAPFGLLTGGLSRQIFPVFGGLKTGGYVTPTTNPINCATISHASVRAIISGATGVFSVHNGATVTLAYFGIWIGGIGAGADRIDMSAVCGGGVWSCLQNAGGFPTVPATGDTSIDPIDFSVTFTSGLDSYTVHFIQP